MDELGPLRALIAEELDQPVPFQATQLARAICDEHTGIYAILFYGSGFWRTPKPDTVFDFYVLVDDYRNFDARKSHALFGYLLPPNVYYLERGDARCKFAVMRMDQFERAAAGSSPGSQIWSRFSQPCRLIYSRDDKARERTVTALARAVITFHEQTLPLFNDSARQARDIWVRGLMQTYSTEWRSERTARADELYQANQPQLDARTRLALPLSTPAKRVVTTGWRRLLAKNIYFLQLAKAVFTFDGGVDYALYKIERQSGLKLEATEFQRRHPLIGAWPLVWKAWRAGALH